MAQQVDIDVAPKGVDRRVEVRGVFVALLTPFDTEGGVDASALTQLVDQVIAAGVDGLVALGTTGELPDLTDADRRLVVKTTVAAARGRVPVVVGVGAIGTAASCAYAQEAERAGADAVLSLPPLFWKLDDERLFRHFRAVAEATSLPVLLYDIPIFVRTSLSADLVRRVALELPSVIGIKMTVSDFGSVSNVLTAVKPVRPDFSVTVGFEDLALSAMLAGGDGVISGMANFCTPALRRLVDGLRDGEPAKALAGHEDVMRLFPVYLQSNPPVLALKALAQQLGAPIQPIVRTPIHEEAAVRDRVESWVRAVSS